MRAFVGAFCVLAFAHAAAAQNTPCPIVGVRGVDSTWQLITSRAITYCVPPRWRPSHPRGDSVAARAWSDGRGDTVAWGPGNPQRFEPPREGTITGSVTVVDAGQPGQPASSPTPPTVTTSVPCQTRNIPYLIGTTSVLVRQVVCGGHHVVTALATSAGVYVQGAAESPEGAAQLLSLVETIRFTGQRP